MKLSSMNIYECVSEPSDEGLTVGPGNALVILVGFCFFLYPEKIFVSGTGL
jgi:hypothetical protein